MKALFQEIEQYREDKEKTLALEKKAWVGVKVRSKRELADRALGPWRLVVPPLPYPLPRPAPRSPLYLSPEASPGPTPLLLALALTLPMAMPLPLPLLLALALAAGPCCWSWP